MSIFRLILSALILTTITNAFCLQKTNTQTVDDDSGKRCESLASADFTGVQDAPAFITSASLIHAQGNMPSYCKVQGYVTP
jgi:hypothetical protein